MRIPLAIYLLLSLIFCWLMGCGSQADLAPTQTIAGVSYPTGTASAPAPQPGASPASLPLTVVRVINTSEWPSGDLVQALADINAQLQVVGSVWGLNVQLQAYGGPFDPGVPSIWISDNPNPPGVAADGVTYASPGVELRGGSAFYDYATVLAEQATSGSPEDYLSHAALLVAAGGPEIGEPYEAYAYGPGSKLCDWAFPAGGAVSPLTGKLSADYAGYAPIPPGGQ